MKFPALLLLMLIAAAGLLRAQQPVPPKSVPRQGDAARVSVLSSDESGITLEITGLALRMQQLGERTMLAPNLPRHLAFGDTATIPGLTFTLAVPFDATDFRAELVSSEPAGTPVDITGRAGLRVANGPVISAGGAAVIRGLRTVALRYQPVRIEGGRAGVPTGARLRLTWKRNLTGNAKNTAPRLEQPSIENALRESIVNYDQGRVWRTASVPPRGLQRASGWGMEQGIVILTGRDAVYSLSGGDLAATGATGLLGTPTDRLRLRDGDEAVPFFVDDANGNNAFDAGDRLEFAGRRHPSDEPGFYYSDVTDTNAYVLRWDGGGPAAPPTTRGDGSAQAPVMAGYDSTLHFERENLYFPGLTLNVPVADVLTIHVSDRVQSERFYWERVLFPYQSTLRFNCSPQYRQDGRTRLDLRVMGLPNEGQVHAVRLRLNGIEIGRQEFGDTADAILSVEVPTGYLVNGANELVVEPITPQAANPDTYDDSVHIFYVDYLELKGSWLPSAWDDVPKVRMPADADGPRRVAVQGLAAPPTTAISRTKRIAVDSVAPGRLIRLVSRQFKDVSLRRYPGFVAQVGDSQVASPADGVGMMLVEVSGSTGTVVRSKFYELYFGSDAELDARLVDARAFIADIPNGNIVIAGFSVGTASRPVFSAELNSAFAALGSTKVLADHGTASWAFAARKGEPASAVEQYATIEQNGNGVSFDAFIPDAAGDRYRAVVTLEGAQNEEFQFGSSEPARTRYHAADSLLGAGNRADMIIITHPVFRAEAERLAAHREQYPPAPGEFKVRVVDVDNIYDEFNDGQKAPIAIRRFLQYADSTWAQPSPGYVLLFGDASWDPMRRLPGAKTIDYIPTNGIPVTDYTYTVAFGDTASYAWQQIIGRLPASMPGDARAMVDKIINYDTQAPARWNKRVVFLAGGANEGEVARHREQNQSLADNYVLSPFFYGDTAFVWRTTRDPDLRFPDSRDAEWARSEVNKGALWMNFSGHGATDVADLDYGFPEQFNNGDRYFVLGTFSCQTGAFAEPSVQVRNERFVTYPEKGSIAAIGGTSFSFPAYDFSFKQQMFVQIMQPAGSTNRYERVLGTIFTVGKYDGYFRDLIGVWDKVYPDGYIARNSLVMYHLLADPSMRLIVSDSAELAFSDVVASGPGGTSEPLPGDSLVSVRARLWNYGMPLFPVDSFPVVASITGKAQETSSDTVWVMGLERWQDLSFSLPLSKEAGEYTIRLWADPLATVPEHYRDDDDTSFTLRIRGNQVQPIDPLPFGRVAGYDNVTIRLLNPPTGPGAVFTVDTTPRFDSPARFTSRETGEVQLAELTTTWTFSIPQNLRTARRFWWHATTLAGDTALASKFPLSEAFTVDPEPTREFIIGGVDQMARGQIVNLVNTEQGIGPGAREVYVSMRVHGQSAFDTTREPRVDLQNFVERNSSVVIVDGKDYNRPAFDGINIIMFRGGRQHGERMAFAFYRTEDVDKFIAAVDTIPADVVVIAWANGTSFDMGYRGPEIRAALRSLGTSQSVLDSVWREDSYALIGGKSMQPDRIRERWVRAVTLRAQGERPPFYVELADTLPAPAGAGTLTLPVMGPATTWAGVDFDRTTGGAIGVMVLGVRRDGRRDTLMTVPDAGTLDLTGISTDVHPRLEFRLAFPDDSILRLRSVVARYTPAPELAIVPSTFGLDQDSVLQGDPGVLNATLVNLSPRAEALKVNARVLLTRDGNAVGVDSVFAGRIGPNDSLRHAFKLPTETLKAQNPFLLELNPNDIPPEIYRTNNAMPGLLRVGLDDISPSLALYADDSRLMDGDYTAARPRFEVRVLDNSRLSLDSQSVKMILDNDFITTSSGGTFVPAPAGNGNYRGSFYYTPPEPLANGEHMIRILLTDASGNGDTTRFIPFYVERELGVRNVVNWPNPCVDRTTFTFMVTGGSRPTRGEIGIYTVAGRKIKTIALTPTELNIGFNRVEWDGHDDDHDRPANGVYLYRVLIEADDLRQEVIDKLVIMR